MSVSDIAFIAPTVPVTLVPGYSYKESKTLELRCHDHLFENAVITDEGGATLFQVKSTYGKSWSFRRSLYDAAGRHVLDLRHRKLDVKNRWVVEAPGPADKTVSTAEEVPVLKEDTSTKDPVAPKGEELASLEHIKLLTRTHSNVDMTVKGRDGAEDVTLHMRQKDHSAIKTFVNLLGLPVAEICLTERNEPPYDIGKDTSAWKIRVAPTMDLTLVSNDTA